MSGYRLFSTHRLCDVLEFRSRSAAEYAGEIPVEQFRASSDECIIDHVVSLRETSPLVIGDDHIEVEGREVQVGSEAVHGLGVAVWAPFDGDPELLLCRPSNDVSTPPSGFVHKVCGVDSGKIELRFEAPSDSLGDASDLPGRIHRAVAALKEIARAVNEEVRASNQKLRPCIAEAVLRRRERLRAHESVLQKLSIPLKRREGAPDLTAIALTKKIIRPLPPADEAKPDYAIRDEDYEYILKVIRHEGRTYETTPSTFVHLQEEDLRNIILGHLNGHFEGLATGEAFRGAGKTDIRIEYENRAAFVAECKMWAGAKDAQDAVGQLQGYLTWRDCKAALVVFNKDVAGFQGLQQKLADALREHERFVEPVAGSEPGEWRFVFKGLDDGERPVTVHVFLFNLFVSPT